MGWCMEALRSGPRQASHESGHHQEVSIWLHWCSRWNFEHSLVPGPPRLSRHKVPGFSPFRLPVFLPLFVKVPLLEVSGIIYCGWKIA